MSAQDTDIFEDAIRRLGAEEKCYALGEDVDEDEHEGTLQGLESSLQACVGNSTETVLYCPKNRIGYFEGGHAKDRFVLKPKRCHLTRSMQHLR